MPSRRIIAMNPVIERKIAMAVSPYVTAERSSTKDFSDDDTSNQNTRPAFSMRTVAQRTEIRMKNWRTKGRFMMAGSMGQKSCAKRCVKGRPTTADTSSAGAMAIVPAVGWAKYRNELPVMNATAVLMVRRIVPNSSSIETRSPLSRRRPRARYDHASAAINAPLNPEMTRSR